jgi:succinyl-CoA synthetase alpha subunit
MNKSLLTAKNVIVQGITGTHGAFHATAMHAAGTNVVAGTSPNKASEVVDGVPVYAHIADIKKDFDVDISVVFVPARFAKAALLEAITEKIPLIICITEGIPVHDMLEMRETAIKNNVTLIGPNCPGVLIPGGNKLGIIPALIGKPGNIGIVSRSGTLTYEVTAGLTAKGIGQSAIIGIGGDPIHGIGFMECLEMFEHDPETHAIVLIGEVGGTEEITAAEYIKKFVTKPIYAYIAGQTAPPGVQMGHAGAILGNQNESAQAKTTALKEAGVHIATSIARLVSHI